MHQGLKLIAATALFGVLAPAQATGIPAKLATLPPIEDFSLAAGQKALCVPTPALDEIQRELAVQEALRVSCTLIPVNGVAAGVELIGQAAQPAGSKELVFSWQDLRPTDKNKALLWNSDEAKSITTQPDKSGSIVLTFPNGLTAAQAARPQ